MSYLSLKPSEIMYSQSSIANKFTNGDHGQIGEVLDDIMEDKVLISRLPKIEVMCIDGSYVSCDNRRLWILKQLERLGRVNEVNVKTTRWMSRQKSARTNDVKIRGMHGPGGIWAFKDIDDVDEVCLEMNMFNF